MRHANEKWILPEGTPNALGNMTHKTEHVHSALLMDLRDELQKLNRLLNCHRFLNMPHTLDRIEINTRKRKAKKRKGAR